MPAAEAEKTPPIVEHAAAQSTPARTDEFEAGNEAVDPDVCVTAGCDRPAALTYLGRPRCQECYEDDVADGDETVETPNHEETEMAKSKKSARKSAKKVTTTPKAQKQQPKGDEVEGRQARERGRAEACQCPGRRRPKFSARRASRCAARR